MARLSLFNVFAAPWFAAIYLLLFASLAGCVLPRTLRLVGSARQAAAARPAQPRPAPVRGQLPDRAPPEPRRWSRPPDCSRGKRFRLRTGDRLGGCREGLPAGGRQPAVPYRPAGAAGVGRRRRHFRLQGQPAAGRPASRSRNTVTALDQFRPGRLVTPGDLQPFSITLDSFMAHYVTSGLDTRRADPRSTRRCATPTGPGGPEHRYLLQVNHPLQVDGVRVYLIGHGYAPVFRITDGSRARASSTARCRSSRSSSQGLTSEGVDQGPGRGSGPARLRRACSCRPPSTSTAGCSPPSPRPCCPG